MNPMSLLNQVNANGLVGKMLGGLATKNFGTGLLAGGAAGALLGGSETVQDVAKLGGLALLGTLAYKSYQTYQTAKTSGQNVSVTDAVKQSAGGMLGSVQNMIAQAKQAAQPQAALPAPSNELALGIIRAMIGAAKADGHMDAAETQKIMGQLETQGLDANEKSLLLQELANTPDVNVIASAANTPEEGAEIYLAALLVCDSQCAAEQAYLQKLADALKLEPAFASALQQQLLASQQRAA